MQIETWIEANKQKFGSDFEVYFARYVLPKVAGLEMHTITVQYPFIDKEGKQRYCDFVIQESDVVRMAIEIDGYDKKGTGTGMTKEDFIDWQRRQASLASQGWHVLRFANNDVRDHPHRCADHISTLLDNLRKTDSGKVQIISLAAPSKELVVVDAKPKTSKKMLLIWIFLLTLIAAVAVPALMHKKVDVSTIPAAPTAIDDCTNPILWDEVKNYIGHVVCAKGPLYAITPKPKLTGSPVYIDVGNVYPNKNRLQLIIWGNNADNFGPEPFQDLKFIEPRIWVDRVYGLVTEFKGIPQIELIDATQINLSKIGTKNDR